MSKIDTYRACRWSFVCCIVLVALVLRWLCSSYRSGDYIHFIGPWYTFISNHGGFAALKYNFSDYNVPYLYFIALFTYIPIDNFLLVKALSIFFDLILAIFTYLIVKIKYTQPHYPLFAACVVLFLPTIFLNSAVWGQCDSIYSAFALGSVYFLLQKRPFWSAIFLGLAISFKLQAIFLLLFFFALLCTRIIPARSFLLTPIIYGILLLPAWIMGRNFIDLLTIYLNQTQEFQHYHLLTLNAPNLFQWIHMTDFNIGNYIGIMLTGIIVVLLTALVLISRAKITAILQIKLALLFVLIVPFFLPQMHERYFYMADVFSVVYACYSPRYNFVAMFVQASSLTCYYALLYGIVVLPLSLVATIMLVAIVVVLFDVLVELYPSSRIMHHVLPQGALHIVARKKTHTNKEV